MANRVIIVQVFCIHDLVHRNFIALPSRGGSHFCLWDSWLTSQLATADTEWQKRHWGIYILGTEALHYPILVLIEPGPAFQKTRHVAWSHTSKPTGGHMRGVL